MTDLKGLIFGMIVVAVIYVLERYLPKWFGAVPGILFLILMIYVFVVKGKGQIIEILVVLVVGEAILNGIWMQVLEARKIKAQKELEKMKAKDNMQK
ncbi:hypothetical protein [Liquorilactobacillus cacaonum]|uniref:Integral membrane protein n=1 Tax=Liquorilactobacillus cacaonum DSM 21116 TaxID=1423729 RepID=A0A0R2CKI4_9LACO|nr:hypothetical protein [Liquorilactobacillus cacaonum]KRM92141.1 hypothetical protein FC80_GL000324 [Liquorilactobacillus cacaonum DSM 21116]